MPRVNSKSTHPVSGGGTAFGVTSLVTGIVALITGWFPIFSIPLGVVAIVFGVLGMKKPDSRGMATAGLVTGIIGTVVGLTVVIFWIIAITAAVNAPTYYYY